MVSLPSTKHREEGQADALDTASLVIWDHFRNLLSYLSLAELKSVEKAFAHAKDLHVSDHAASAKRMSGKRYEKYTFSHSATVAAKLAMLHADATTLSSVLLWAAVEKSLVDVEDILKTYGPAISTLINDLLAVPSEKDPENTGLVPHVETLRKRCILMQQDIRIMTIVLVNRLTAIEEIQREAHPKYWQRYLQETFDIYAGIANLMSMQDMRDSMDGICLQLLKPALFATLSQLREETTTEVHMPLLEKMRTAFSLHCPDLHCRLEYEENSWRDLREWQEHGVSDAPPMMLSLVCEDTETCYKALGLLHQIWQQEMYSFRDTINTPDINGQQTLHTTVILPDATVVHIRICTQEMYTYAHGGIATLCFEEEAVGLTDYMPWLRTLALLAEETTDSSEHFVHTLKHNVLCAHIRIHGKDGEVLFLPEGATALDAALQSFGEKTLWLESVFVNGMPASFKTGLSDGDTVTLKYSAERTVQRKWLSWVQTYNAAIVILAALGKSSTARKIAIGMELLEQVMRQKGKGFLEEFDTSRFPKLLEQLGFSSFEDACVAIADGSIEVEDVYVALFGLKEDSVLKKKACVVRCCIQESATDVMNAVLRLYQKYASSVEHMRIRQPFFRGGYVNVRFRGMLSSVEQQQLTSELEAAGAQKVRCTLRSSRIKFIIAASTMITLWGIDPILASWILSAGAAPASIAVLRAWTVTFCALLLMLATNRSRMMAKIPLHHRSLWAAGGAFALINIATYLAILHASPALYNTVLRGNAIILMTPVLLAHHAYRRFTVALLCAVFGIVLLSQTNTSLVGLLLSLCALGSFSTYSAASARFQRRVRIAARYPQFLFYTSLISAVALLPLLFVYTPFPSTELMLFTMAYSAFVIIVPYAIYYYLIRFTGSQPTHSRWIHGGVVVTLIAQMAFFGWQDMHLLIPAAAILVFGSTFSAAFAKQKSVV